MNDDRHGRKPAANLLQEGERVMRLCNACRYCEGYCAVFPAMERRLSFPEQDLHYLANLCHNCSECYYACPYAPPHEFALNLPRTFSEIRTLTYGKYAWPGYFADLIRKGALLACLTLIAAPALFLIGMLRFIPSSKLFAAHTVGEGSFYVIVSHHVMTLTFGIISLGVLAALGIGLRAFWRDTGAMAGAFLSLGPLAQAVWDTMRLKYLEGGPQGAEEGCAYPNDLSSQSRRWFHHLTFYGFFFCFAATTVAAIYHYVFGWVAPYRFQSAPVVLGIAGGLGLLIGPIGLLWLKCSRNPELTDAKQTRMDFGLLALLFFTSLTGFLLLALRETPAMGVLLAVHLGVVMAFFLTVPYGKFVHAIYRFAALVRNAIEQGEDRSRRPEVRSRK